MEKDVHIRSAVLIVEDEPLIRMEAVDMIEEAGFRTFDVGSADSAISTMEQNEDIGILFTDIEMPGTMDGLELAAYFQKRWPKVAIIIASGAVEVKTLNLPEKVCFFPKPYPTDRITKALKSISNNRK
ncbi:response regulator [Sulfitobacter sp. F26169L]|uniref:response regulator n=1 Tax=Sulfitobacter sp. F26169L TaxID=2996015 RepID=UPI002260F98E|nr:response regulator [Sulfitobacter sp. F26169L]MCX7568191.1 response regulator [Sulfitobacter sp. F26169L]